MSPPQSSLAAPSSPTQPPRRSPYENYSVPLPDDVGVPTDIVRFRGALHVLTSRALLRLILSRV